MSIEVVPAVRIDPDRSGPITHQGFAVKGLCVSPSEAMRRMTELLDGATVAENDMPEFWRLWEAAGYQR